jgi:cytochrome c biogenesis protein CcdA
VWGILIGLGVAMALQPLPVLAVVFLLSVENGIRKAWAFALGEFLVMFAIGAATVALHLGTTRHSASRPASFVTLGAGVVLVGAGAWLTARVRRGTELAEPRWLAKLDRMEPWPAFLLGLFLPTYVIAIAAGAHIVGTHPGTPEAVAGMLVFLLVGMCTVYAPILLAQLAPERSAPLRARLRDWLAGNWRSVGAALLLAVGALLVVKGVVALD